MLRGLRLVHNFKAVENGKNVCKTNKDFPQAKHILTMARISSGKLQTGNMVEDANKALYQ